PLNKPQKPLKPALEAAASLCPGLGSSLAGFFLQAFAGDANSLLLVGIGRPQRTNVRGHLANLSFIRSADDQVRLLVHGDLNTFRNRELDRVRLPQRKIDHFALELRAVADADDVHFLFEALRDAVDRVGHQRAGQAVNRAELFRVTLHVEYPVLLLKGNASGNQDAHLALGPLNVNLVRGHGDFYAGRQWNWFVSDA